MLLSGSTQLLLIGDCKKTIEICTQPVGNLERKIHRQTISCQGPKSLPKIEMIGSGRVGLSVKWKNVSNHQLSSKRFCMLKSFYVCLFDPPARFSISLKVSWYPDNSSCDSVQSSSTAATHEHTTLIYLVKIARSSHRRCSTQLDAVWANAALGSK